MGVGLIVVGVYAVRVPRALARRYGVAVEGHAALAYVRATGVRDAALGLVLLAIVIGRAGPLLIVFAGAGAALSAADYWLATHHGGARPDVVARASHLSGAAAFLVLAAFAMSQSAR